MDGIVEMLKRLDLVAFLSKYYGLELRRQGAAFACCSPFTTETKPSFFVRQDGPHWLFKDFSSGLGGSIFDFVERIEGLADFSATLSFLGRLLPKLSQWEAQRPSVRAPFEGPVAYDMSGLYERFCREDPQVCRAYLLKRGIDPRLVDELIEKGIVVHNRYEGQSYCTFAVYDAAGHLCCLDNHAVEGRKKFVLGKKHVFSLEWKQLERAKIVFVTEGIIDYLSVKTLERQPVVGLALLGTQLCFEASLLVSAEVLQAALDADRGGHRATLELQDRYPEKALCVYDLQGHKDPNELLAATGGKRSLNPERKLELYRAFQRSSNKTRLAEEWGLDRSYVYEVVRDCEHMLLASLSARRPGRRPQGVPVDVEQARAKVQEWEARYELEAKKREELYCRSEFLALRLKHAEQEVAEARGEAVTGDRPAKKRQIKKKRRKKRSRKSRH